MSENVPSDMCAQRRFKSTCAFSQSDQNLHWVHFLIAKDQRFFMRTTSTLIRPPGRTCQKVRFLKLRLRCLYVSVYTRLIWNLFIVVNCYQKTFLITKHSSTKCLTFTPLWANSADDKLMIFFLIFPETGFDISCKLSSMETICRKCQI